MVTNALKIDSNTSGLRYAEEDRTQTIGTLPTAALQFWYQLEPNTETNFGGNVKTVARMPINAGRQLNKGVVVDLDVEGTIQQDLTQDGLTRLFQGYFFANLREADDTLPFNGNTSVVNLVVHASHKYELAYGDVFDEVVANYMIFATGFAKNANNGLKIVSSSSYVKAGGVLTSSSNYGTSDTVTIGTRTYHFVASPATDGDVKIALTEAGSITNLTNAINDSGGTPGTDYFVTAPDPNVTAVAASHTVTVTAIRSGYAPNSVATTDVMVTGNGVWGSGTLTGGVADVVVTDTNVQDETPSTTARLEAVGFQGASGDLTITNDTVDYPAMSSTSLDFTTLPLIPGEWIWIGGDTVATEFDAHPTDNGWARIHAIATHTLTFDKTSSEMITDPGTAKTIQLFWGKVLKNEASPTFQVRRTYTLERTLGASNIDFPTQLQAEYLVGAVPNEATFNIKTAAKVEIDLSFMAITKTEIPAGTPILSDAAVTAGSAANAPVVAFEDAYNTTSHVNRAKMAILSTFDSSPTSLFAELTELKLVIKNNLKANKAVKKLGAFEVTAGFFEVTGTVQVYFNDVAAMESVRQGADVTLDFAFARNNQGIMIDLPLMVISDARADVKINEPIMLPITMQMGRDRTFNHTALMEFFSYLPTVAMPTF
jgi:hypothetical protein